MQHLLVASRRLYFCEPLPCDNNLGRSPNEQAALGCSILISELAPTLRSMNVKLPLYVSALFSLVAIAVGFAQTPASDTQAGTQYSKQGSAVSSPQQQGTAVSYASITQVNGLLAELEARSKSTQADLSKLRIDRWKTDSSNKKQILNDAESIQRNLQNALPEMMAQLRNAPEDLGATFKIYRNLDALYGVLSSVVESAGAFGPKDDFQALSNDLNGFEGVRRQLADRMENLASSKEQEIVRLRADLKTAEARIPATPPPPKKTVVDDTEPKKPPAKKKPMTKKPTTTPASTPPAQSQPQQSKPQ